MNRDVRITGMAWTTVLGTGLDEVWSRLLAGDSGLRPVPSRHPLRNTAAAPVTSPAHGPDAARRQVALASDTVVRALDDAGPLARAGRPRLVIGTSYGAHLDEHGTTDLYAWAEQSAVASGIEHPPVAVSTACSSGSDAVLVAARLIQDGTTELCVCGGADVLTEAKRLGHSALGTMSPTALRAFAPDSDGTLLGEGAGFLVLEAAESARRRGAPSYATFRGGGAANDAAGMTAPDPSGEQVAAAMRSALADAGMRFGDLTVISAHGTGTPANDAVETAALSRFATEGHRPVVFAAKGAFGHTLGATGALEAIALVLALRDRRVPPVHGLRTVRADFPFPLPVGEPLAFTGGAGMSLTLGFGGFDTGLILERTTDDLR